MSLPGFASLVRDLLAEQKMSANALAQEIPVDAGHLSQVLILVVALVPLVGLFSKA